MGQSCSIEGQSLQGFPVERGVEFGKVMLARVVAATVRELPLPDLGKWTSSTCVVVGRDGRVFQGRMVTAGSTR